VVQSGAKNDNEELNSKKKRKKKQQIKAQAEEKKEEEEETVFKKETDPSKLGKALSEAINKKTIIGTLLMLMILPLLSRSETDYSGHYAIREAFWFGRSSCTDPNGFYCVETGNSKWVTEEGWYEILRGLTRTSMDDS